LISSPPALQLYTLRDQLAAGRLPVLRRVAGFGYGAVEPYDVQTDPDRLRAELDEAGLAVCSVHARALGDSADALLRGVLTVGGGTVIVPSVPRERFADAGRVADLARELNEAAARAADYGLRLGYHNHEFELAADIGGRTGLEVLADALDPAVILEVDTYWAAVGGQDVPALLGRLGDRVRYLHVKDGPVNRPDPQTALGRGRMPVAAILAACPSAEWHVVELDSCATDMLTAVGDSLAWLAEHNLAAPVRSGAGS
jgi:sugar phosphate isomerase/epimerase